MSRHSLLNRYMNTTAPCGVPSFDSDHWPSSDTPAFNHFWMRRSMRGCPTRCSINFTAHSIDKLSKNPRSLHRAPSSLASSGFPQSSHPALDAGCDPAETRTRSLEVHLVNLVENGRYGLLNNLVLLRRNAQRTLPPVSLRYIDSA